MSQGGMRRVAVVVARLSLTGCALSCATEPKASSLRAGLERHEVPVKLALEVDNGRGVPLRLQAGRRFAVDQIDLRASRDVDRDEPGLHTLRADSDFSTLDWRGLRRIEHERILSPNPDGTYIDRRFFRNAAWMRKASLIVVWQVDAEGERVDDPVYLPVGPERGFAGRGAFFIRRLRAIQWAQDCRPERPVPSADCRGATSFVEEALVELRNGRPDQQTLRLHPDTRALRLFWSARGGHPYRIPVEQVERADLDYGFDIDVEALTPTGPAGYYLPGQTLTFRVTLRDGRGQRLHPAGSLPTFQEVLNGRNTAGIQYYRAFPFVDPSATYYRRKHRERMLMAQIIGPAQDIQPIRSVAPLEAFLDDADTEVVGRPDTDGVFAEFTTLPPARVIFGGAFVPGNAPWRSPNVDTFDFHLPDDAKPGTYRVTVKGRRTYLGEDVPRSTTIEVPVGTRTRTEARLSTGNCQTCHRSGGELGTVLHGNADLAACAGCHVPLSFELEGPIFVRTHFIHSRSRRFGVPLSRCSTCHLDVQGIQRTSQAACMSCHTSYPPDHVDRYGPIESMYIGGGASSFVSCGGECHRNHPGGGFTTSPSPPRSPFAFPPPRRRGSLAQQWSITAI